MAKAPKHAVGLYRGSVRMNLTGDGSSKLRNEQTGDTFAPNGCLNDPGGRGTGGRGNADCTERKIAQYISGLWGTATLTTGP